MRSTLRLLDLGSMLQLVYAMLVLINAWLVWHWCMQDAIKQYGTIFSWLLCLKRVDALMRNLWLDLGSLDGKWEHPDQAPSRRAQLPSLVVQRLRTLQLFRHEAAHLTGVLQAYMQGQLLGKCWQQLCNSVRVSHVLRPGEILLESRSYTILHHARTQSQ